MTDHGATGHGATGHAATGPGTAGGTFSVEKSVRRVGGGRVIVGGSPLTLIRLSAAGATVFDTIERGAAPPATKASIALVDRLLDAGIIHPRPAGSPPGLAVAVVIPSFAPDRDDLVRLVGQCRSGGSMVADVIIVDDASEPPIAPIDGATIVRRAVNGGPAAARQTGIAVTVTPLVAFVDTDVELPDDWLAPLVAHFADERVALVAPRIVGASSPAATPSAARGISGRRGSRTTRFDQVHSPLDLGTCAARVRSGTRVSYVPAAVLVGRTAVLRDIGGFDEAMRVGEDVDLVWRLDEAGHRIRYEPATTATHQPRPTLAAWMRQRFDYGTSAAPLAVKHPGAVAPVRVSGWSAASWFVTLAGWPVVGAAIATATTVLLARKLRHVPDGMREAVRLAGLGHLFAGRSLASAVTRAWWPAAVLAALVSRRCRRVLVAAAIAPAAIDYVRMRPPLDPATYLALRLFDDASYGAGVAVGSLRAGTFDALAPDFTSWPNRPSSSTAVPSAR